MTGTDNSTILNRTRFNFSAITHLIKSRILRLHSNSLENYAVKSWEIAPAETTRTPSAFFLPDQLERVTGWAFASAHPRFSMNGGISNHSATKGYLLKDVWLIDGTLYKNNAHSWLTPRLSKWIQIKVNYEVEHGAIFCTASGNKYFGNWLMDDCTAYDLASAEGTPVTTDQAVTQHTQGYEDWLGMKPIRMRNTYFKELVIFDDIGQNRHKHKRFRSMNVKVLSHVKVSPHPGVFILRGGTGELRLLHNELAIAEYLKNKRGFKILDPAKTDVPTIVSTCAGAQMIVGVEGSGLIHGILALQEGGSVLALQPPDRFVKVYKDLTDRDQQNFGFVVGHAQGNGFHINPHEIEKTIDLFPV